ncbi:phosphoribosylanthranilate isomerase [Aquisediminimonas sediminicola]|uniref:phosphoribosylanthranilate isomerase n=1 Tax=Alteraquisediminimonas sediminicola TaxID=2676787 RepID=UPI001C8D0326|nr:phosphoribosylanthranilate isomerase [Aquisediminimonas sediminicola]
MPVQAKICGLSTPDTLEAAILHGASHVGFVHFPKSPRHLGFEALAGLAQHVPDRIGRVGVIVDADDEMITAMVQAGRLTAIQLHGKETAERVAEVKRLTGIEVWKAVAVRTGADLREAARFVGAADLLLYDAKPPEGADLPGGLGISFDWELLRGVRHALPWALSGGLDADSVAQAVAITGATLLDISSGVESTPGVKNVDKIAQFLKATSLL